MGRLGFNGWNPLIDGSTDKAVGAVAYAGNIHLFAVGLEGTGRGRIYEKIRRSGSWPGGWREVEGGGNTDSGLAATVYGGMIYLFAKGLDGQIYFNRKSATDAPWQSTWTPVPGLASDAAPAVAVYNNKIHLFAKRAGDNKVFTSRFPEPNAFSAWGEVAGSGTVRTGLGVSVYEDYTVGEGPTLFLHGVGIDDQKVYLNKWLPLESRWSGWFRPGTADGTTDAPVTGASVARPGRTPAYRYQALFVKGIDDRQVYLNERGYDEPDWTGFYPLGGQVRDAVTPVVLDNVIHLYGVGDGFGIFENIQMPLTPA